jgi:hypothetical protein
VYAYPSASSATQKVEETHETELNASPNGSRNIPALGGTAAGLLQLEPFQLVVLALPSTAMQKLKDVHEISVML